MVAATLLRPADKLHLKDEVCVGGNGASEQTEVSRSWQLDRKDPPYPLLPPAAAERERERERESE